MIGDASLRCEVETDFLAVESLREEWDATVLTLGAPVCMTFDWLKTWWVHYGDRKELRILAFPFFKGRELRDHLPVSVQQLAPTEIRLIEERGMGAFTLLQL